METDKLKSQINELEKELEDLKTTLKNEEELQKIKEQEEKIEYQNKAVLNFTNKLFENIESKEILDNLKDNEYKIYFSEWHNKPAIRLELRYNPESQKVHPELYNTFYYDEELDFSEQLKEIFDCLNSYYNEIEVYNNKIQTVNNLADYFKTKDIDFYVGSCIPCTSKVELKLSFDAIERLRLECKKPFAVVYQYNNPNKTYVELYSEVEDNDNDNDKLIVRYSTVHENYYSKDEFHTAYYKCQTLKLNSIAKIDQEDWNMLDQMVKEMHK